MLQCEERGRRDDEEGDDVEKHEAAVGTAEWRESQV